MQDGLQYHLHTIIVADAKHYIFKAFTSGIILNLIFYCTFVLWDVLKSRSHGRSCRPSPGKTIRYTIWEYWSLNVYAFYLQPAYEVLAVQNSDANFTIEPFCIRQPCQNWRIATIVFTTIRIIIIGRVNNTSFYENYQKYLWDKSFPGQYMI